MARPEMKKRNDLIKKLVKKHTYEEIGKMFGIHKSRIYQIVQGKSTKPKVEVIPR